MSPEMQLVDALTDEKMKLAKVFESMTVEELAEVFKKEKTATGPECRGMHRAKRKQATGMARSSGSNIRSADGGAEDTAGFKDQVKAASVYADRLGRELAHEAFQVKQANLAGTMLRGVMAAKPARSALVGAGVGAAAGALKGNGGDPNSTLLGRAAGGALLGAGAGAGLKKGLGMAAKASPAAGNWMRSQMSAAGGMKTRALKPPAVGGAARAAAPAAAPAPVAMAPRAVGAPVPAPPQNLGEMLGAHHGNVRANLLKAGKSPAEVETLMRSSGPRAQKLLAHYAPDPAAAAAQSRSLSMHTQQANQGLRGVVNRLGANNQGFIFKGASVLKRARAAGLVA